MYPERYSEDGLLLTSCDSSGQTLWGEDKCNTVITSYAANLTPVAACKGDACNDPANIKCYEGNDAGLAEYTSSNSCELVDVKYGFSQWQDKSLIKCTKLEDLSNTDGFANCINIDGEWKARSSYVNVD